MYKSVEGRLMENYILLKEKICEQKDIYKELIDGNYSFVCYKKACDHERGVYDANCVNRKRMSYYLLFEKNDNEIVIRNLFEEEIKDRKTNSFQGIGSTLENLTYLLKRYNANGIYNDLFETAKNANFDCVCGYDKNMVVEDEIQKYDLPDLIQIAIELNYTTIVEKLVCEWKSKIEIWNESNCLSLIQYNNYLENYTDNENLYRMQVNIAKAGGDDFNITTQYHRLMHYYVEIEQFEKAYSVFEEMKKCVNLKRFMHVNLYRYILEDCMDIVVNNKKEAKGLWKWAKPQLKKQYDKMYGNLFKKSIMAAKSVGDSYADQLEQEYENWKLKMKL